MIILSSLGLFFKVLQRPGMRLFNIDRPYLFYLLLFNAVFLLSMLNAVYYDVYFKKIFQLFLYTVVLYLLVADYIHTDEAIYKLKNAFINAAVLISLIGVIQEIFLIIGYADPLSFLSRFIFFQATLSSQHMGFVYGRVNSLFANPNAFAMALVIPIALTVEKVLLKKNFISFIQLFSLICGVFVSGSRTVMVALFLIVFLYGCKKIVLFKGSMSHKLKNFFYVIMVTIICLVPFEKLLLARLGPLMHMTRPTAEMVVSEQHRIALWRFGLYSWQHHPVFGIGLGNFAPMSKSLAKYGVYEDNLTGWMNILVETGLCGIIAFLLLLYNILKKSSFNALFIGIVVFSLSNIVQDHFFLSGTGPIFWLSCHLLICEKRYQWKKYLEQ